MKQQEKHVQTFKGELIVTFIISYEEQGTLLSLLYEATITLISKPDKYITAINHTVSSQNSLPLKFETGPL